MGTSLTWDKQVPPIDPVNSGIGWGMPIVNPDKIRRHSVEVAAMLQWPAVAKSGVQFTYNSNDSGNMLEYWPKGETGDPSYQRPANIPIQKNGIDINSSQTRPADIAGDIVSHQLVYTDPVVKQTYANFQKSMTPEQHKIMRDQYTYARQNEGEKRSFNEWRDTSGMPAYFRGYTFDQWGPDSKSYYTPEQLQMLDSMKGYLQKK